MNGRRIRHTKDFHCPICGGHENLPAKRGVRCYGYTLPDLGLAFCTREQFGGNAPFRPGANAYRHRLTGDCPCGATHGYGYTPPTPAAWTASAARDKELPPLDPDTLHAIYSRYAELCRIRPEHLAMYEHRGTVDLQAAQTYGFCSLPLGDIAARHVVATLTAEFGEETIALAPGFFYSKRGNSRRLITHTATRANDAAVIPARDEHGRIIAMIRHKVSGDTAKYRPFFGTKSNQVYAVAGPEWNENEERIIHSVEGVLKGYVAAIQGNIRVFAMPAAHLSERHAEAINSLTPDTVAEDLDADKFSNSSVARLRTIAHRRLLNLHGPEVQTAVWEIEEGKGIDDLLKNGHRPRLRTVPRRDPITARRPHPVPEPGPIPAGAPMTDVRLETREQIADFIRHRRTNQGKVLPVFTPAGVGKSVAAQQELVAQGVTARVVVGTKTQAAEWVNYAPDLIHFDEGRNGDNCANFAVVDAARKKQLDVDSIVCKTCPFRGYCLDTPDAYYQQFKRPGIHVGTSFMLNSGEFLRRGELLVIDDAKLLDPLLDQRTIAVEDISDLAGPVGDSPIRALLWDVVGRAILASEKSDGLDGPVTGARAWDYLGRAAGGRERLRSYIDATPPDAGNFAPAPDEGKCLTVEDVNAAPPAVLATLVRALHAELPKFLLGGEFNSRLQFQHGKLTVSEWRSPLVDRETGVPLLQSRSVLILDATPQQAVIDRFAAMNGLTALPSYQPTVRVPPNTKFIQIADAFFGKSTVTRTRKLKDGTEARPGRDALLRSFQAALRDYTGDRIGVICAKAVKDAVIALGIPVERIITFGAARGLNQLDNCDTLFVLGRPQAPESHALYMANLLHLDEGPISPHMVMQDVAYGAYHGPDGLGRAITVPTFEDPRVAACHASGREDELLQCLMRARPYTVADPQTSLFESEETGIARKVGLRQSLKIVLLTAQPVPGLPIHELIYDPAPADPNALRHDAAMDRIRTAVQQLEADGVPVNPTTVARQSGASRNTTMAALRELGACARGRSSEDNTNRPRAHAPNPEREPVAQPPERPQTAVAVATPPETTACDAAEVRKWPGNRRAPTAQCAEPDCWEPPDWFDAPGRQYWCANHRHQGIGAAAGLVILVG